MASMTKEQLQTLISETVTPLVKEAVGPLVTDMVTEQFKGADPNSFDVDSDVMRHSLKSAIDASSQEVIRLAVKQQVLQYTGRVD